MLSSSFQHYSLHLLRFENSLDAVCASIETPCNRPLRIPSNVIYSVESLYSECFRAVERFNCICFVQSFQLDGYSVYIVIASVFVEIN